MAQGYPHLVYGTRLNSPVQIPGIFTVEQYCKHLGLSVDLTIQSPDEEQGWNWEDICPVIFVKASEIDPYTVTEFKGSLSISQTDPAWDKLLTNTVQVLNLEAETPRWYAFVLTY